jgi:CheY-like chemotaxis protein
LEKYNYYVHAKWEDVRFQDNEAYLKNITIVHVDDNPLFSAAIEKTLKEKYFPDSNWIHFNDTTAALQFVGNQLHTNMTISLIITDLTPHGIQGYKFADLVRTMEIESEATKAPIIVMSMLDADHPSIHRGLEDKTFNSYSHKSEDVRYFGSKLKEMLRPNILGIPGYLNSLS